MTSPRRSKTRLWLFTALLTPFAVICLALAWFSLRGFYDAYLLQTDGEVAEARVTYLEDKGGKGSSYRANYTFRVGPDEFEGSTDINKKEFQKITKINSQQNKILQPDYFLLMSAQQSIRFHFPIFVYMSLNMLLFR